MADYSGIPDPQESRKYTDYEIPFEARLNIKEIEKCLREGRYNTEEMVREHLDLLENLDAEVTNALESERKIGRYNATLKHDQDKVRKLVKQLEQKLNEVDII
jgi:hypothetical protein